MRFCSSNSASASLLVVVTSTRALFLSMARVLRAWRLRLRYELTRFFSFAALPTYKQRPWLSMKR